ncbi:MULTISPECIES: TonB-dependent receptor plug domain-containing protein [Chelativorans]|uniref:TonB-dependent receptor n=1 Tax=Chelativorans sp. (strain BNC1) TaxID=266779 RepID=Q11GL9_CHESB|nr:MULTISPECIES: TonB-dependent receptor [Chelativorans]
MIRRRTASSLTVGASALATLLAGSAGAQDIDLGEIVVTPNRAPTALSGAGSTVEVIDEDSIEAQSRPLLTDYLNELPGLYVATQGGVGKETSLSIRGADKKYIKTLFNGIDISDPSATQVQPSFEHLLIGGVSHIEVLKGSQSTLYGADAVAGVIDISTLRNDPVGTTHRVLVEGGSNETGRASYGLSNVTETGRMSLDIAGLYTGGISAALVNGNPLIDPGQSSLEDDFYQNVTASFAGEQQMGDNVTIFGSGLLINSKGAFDDSGLPPTDNEMNEGHSRQMAGRAGISFDLMEGRFRNTVSGQLSEIDRDISSVSIFGPFEGEFNGRRGKLDYQGAFDVNDRLTLQFGADYERRQAHITNNYGTDTRDADWIAGIWGQVIAEPIENLTVTAGLRHDDHSRFGGYTTYRGAVAYLFPSTGTKLRSSIGTGFRAPSLYENNYVSYDPTVPLPDLEPEESFSWDVGMDQSFMGGRGTASLTYFQLDTDNLIDYDFIRDTYIQFEGTTRRRGVEMGLAYEVNDWLSLGGNYTYTTAVEADDERRPRIPRHMIGLLAEARPAEKWTVSASAKIALDTVDFISPSFGTYERVELDDYVLLNAKVAYKPTEDTELYLRVENLLDQDYQTVYGYGSPGISAFAGFKAKFGP